MSTPVIDQDNPFRDTLLKAKHYHQQGIFLWYRFLLLDFCLAGWNVLCANADNGALPLQFWMCSGAAILCIAMMIRLLRSIRRERRIIALLDNCINAQSFESLDFWIDQMMAT